MTGQERERRLPRRAALATGAAAAAAGGAVLTNASPAQAADGDPLLVGRPNAGTTSTRLTSTVNASALSVNNTDTGSQAHAIFSTAANGYGLATSSVGYNGARMSCQQPARYGAVVEHASTTSGTGTALIAIHRSLGAGAGGATAVRGFQGPDAEALLNTVRTQHWPAAGEFAAATGVIGASNQPGGTGIVGYSESGTGVWAGTNTPGQDALYASGNTTIDGDATVNGTLTKMGGSFRIDHPLDPANRYLSHSFVESPDMKNVYDGVTELDETGTATVELADWFEALNRDYRYQLTPVGGPAPNLHIKTEITNGRFTIAGGQPGQRISWLITGIRKDRWAEDNRIPVEHLKPDTERGTYLHPQTHSTS